MRVVQKSRREEEQTVVGIVHDDVACGIYGAGKKNWRQRNAELKGIALTQLGMQLECRLLHLRSP